MSFRSFILSSAFVFGCFMPSSFDGVPRFYGVFFIVTMLWIAALYLLGHHASRFALCSLGFIPALIAFFSFTSGIHTLVFAAVVPSYLMLAAWLGLRASDIRLSRSGDHIFFLVNIINIAFGLGIVLNFNSANTLLLSWYAMGDRYFLIERMLPYHKPVIMFATHSLAAFMLFLFCYSCLRAFRSGKGTIYLILSLAYMFLIVALGSVTAIGMVLFCLGLTIYTLWTMGRRWILAGLVALAITIPSLMGLSWSTVSDASILMLSNEGGGFVGRYKQGTPLYDSIEYIKQHPLQPIGASFTVKFADVSDSGYVYKFLMGSVPIVLLVYGGYFIFLRSNLISRMDFLVLLMGTMALELGSTILPYVRAQCILMFICCYLNSLPHCSSFGADTGRVSDPITGLSKAK